MFSISCSLFENTNSSVGVNNVYVAKQGSDEIAVINLNSYIIDYIDIDYPTADCSNIYEPSECNSSGCHWMQNFFGDFYCHSMNMDGPHFTVIDEELNYLFVSNIESGWIGQYDALSHELIDTVIVGNMPALMVVDKNLKKLYISKMMTMVGMEQESRSISVIDYSNQKFLLESQSIELGSPSPHALAINSTGNQIFVATYEGDWLFKIDAFNKSIIDQKPLELGFSEDKSFPIKRLKPVQCTMANDSLLFIACEGGSWTSGSFQDSIPGQVQMWNTNSMELIDSFEFDVMSRPWHIVSSPIENNVYVVLKGKQNTGLYPNSNGVASISFANNTLELNWKIHNDQFHLLHGIDISDNGKRLFISGESDGNLYEISSDEGAILNTIFIGNNSKLQGVTFFSK